MRTSYKLLILAGLLLFGTLTAFDFALKAEYDKGNYKNGFANFTELKYTNFDAVDINSSAELSVRLAYSNRFNISVSNNINGIVKITQKGARLIIDMDQRLLYGTIMIQCPVIKEVKSNAALINNNVRTQFEGVTISGFSQDSMTLIGNNEVYFNLSGNKLKHLTADMGRIAAFPARLEIGESNKIISANINIQNKSVLTLKNATIEHLNMNVSDSAEINLSGISTKLLKSKE